MSMPAGQPPQLLPTQVSEGEAAGIRYRIEGELVPVLHLSLDGRMAVYFEHHIVLWKSPGLEIGIHALQGGFKRVVAGMQIFMTEAKGPGELAFSRDGVGHIVPLPLATGQGIVVREHQLLAASTNVAYSFQRLKGIGNMLAGGSGFFVDTFSATQGEGVVWLHGYGNVFEKQLSAGEEIDIEPGGWIYHDHSVTMSPKLYGLKTGIFGGAGQLVFNRFRGPGRVGVQSMYVHLPTSD